MESEENSGTKIPCEPASEQPADAAPRQDVIELNLGADLELDEDDLDMIFALGLC